MIVVSQASARVTTDSRLSPIAAATHGQRTTVNASWTTRQSGPRHQISPTASASSGSTSRKLHRPPAHGHAQTST